MFKINDNYLKLPGSYLFSTIAKKVAAYSEAHPDADIIRLGIGDVTQPIAPAIIEAVHKAADEMGTEAGFPAAINAFYTEAELFPYCGGKTGQRPFQKRHGQR